MLGIAIASVAQAGNCLATAAHRVVVVTAAVVAAPVAVVSAKEQADRGEGSIVVAEGTPAEVAATGVPAHPAG